MAESATALLQALEAAKVQYGGGAAGRKLGLLQKLTRRRLTSADEVLRLHEALCFLCAYPDDEAVLEASEGMLAGFSARGDLRRHRRGLENSGIAGTDISYPFYWFTARHLSRTWPGHLTIDWRDFEKEDELENILHLLVHYSETPALDEMGYTVRQWIEELKGPDETDADFLIRRFEALPMNSFARETLFESFDFPFRLAPGSDTPSRTRGRYPGSPPYFRKLPLRRGRPDLKKEVRRGAVEVHPVSLREGRRLVDLTREAMVTRSRDLDAFASADARDVRMIDCGEGLQFVCMGVLPERRLIFEAQYGFLTLRSGVPIGYVLINALFRTAEVAFNMFESFRAAESAWIYARVLTMTKQLLGVDAFMVPPYQLGHDNKEGLESGAWWFYYKLGLRPEDPSVKKLLARELERMANKPGYRSDLRTLNRLSSENMYLYLGRRRRDVLGRISFGKVGAAITRALADRFGGDREKAVATARREATQRLGVPLPARLSPGERLAWERWSPLIMILPGVEDWTAAERGDLLQVALAKGGTRETRFIELFDAHEPLKRSLKRLL